MSEYNDLSVEVYSSGTTLIRDPRQELGTADSIRYSTSYPGGIYGAASFFIPHPPTHWWELTGGQRVVIRNKGRLCYEGYISNLESISDTTGQGMDINCIGAWGHILMNWQINKNWADTRVTDDVWVWQSDVATYTGCEKCYADRSNRIRFTPKAEAWTNGQFAAVRYTMPTGETIKRLKYSWQLAEGGQAWEISVWRTNNPGGGWTQMATNAVSGDVYTTGTTTIITASSTGNIDVELATASQYVELRYYARGNQTPTSDGTYFGDFTVMEVYSEMGSINMQEIAKDIVGIVTDVNSAVFGIYTAGSPRALVPYITDGPMTAADILRDITNIGDAAYNRWEATLLGSEHWATTIDGKPQLVVLSGLTTTDYEYAVSFDGSNLASGIKISQDFDNIANYIIVGYTDANGRRQYRTPTDLGTLTDATSVAAYGRHTVELNAGNSTSDIADNIGLRYLASYKDPQYRLTGPIAVQGYIRGKQSNNLTSASEIRAGKRVRIENYLTDVTGADQGLTFLVTQTAYDHDREICQLAAGVPQSPLMQTYSHPITVGGETPGAGGGTVVRSVTDEMLKRMGITRAKWAKLTPAQRRARRKQYGV